MGRSLKILHLADSHIGAEWPPRARHDRPRRGDDFVDSFRRVLDPALAEDIDLVIHAGDLFDTPEPCGRARAAAGDALLSLARAGLPIVLVPGNHERHAIASTLLLSHPNIHVASEPRTFLFRLHGLDVGVSALPRLGRTAAARFPAALQAARWDDSPADLRILALHETFESAMCGPVNFRFRSGDGVIERDAVPTEFDYVACGHIHRHQELRRTDGNGPPIAYAGSTDRITFAEADEPKGCVIVEETGGKLIHRFVPHNVRPMSVWPVLLTGLSQGQITEQIAAIIESLPPRAVAQIRLAGRPAEGAFRNLRFAEMARRLRPDALVTISAQAVEFTAPSGGGHARGVAATPPVVPANSWPEVDTETSRPEIDRLPQTCGVYALYDHEDRLLYVGKARNVRTRVRTHARDSAPGNYFRGWGRRIARIAVRAAASELEALLLEAEMIRLLQPPFNRQMRKWTGYCYLCANGSPHGQLEIRAEPHSDHPCFGPFRSRQTAETVREGVAAHFGLAQCFDTESSAAERSLSPQATGARLCHRYFSGLCSGPCGERVPPEEYADRLHRRDALLCGADDSSVRELESLVETELRQGDPDEAAVRQADLAQHLRFIFGQCAILRRAESLAGGLILLPHADAARRVALLAADHICFDVLARESDDARRVLAKCHALAAGVIHSANQRLPREVLDSYGLVARQLAKPTPGYRFIAREEITHFDAPGLLTAAFPAE